VRACKLCVYSVHNACVDRQLTVTALCARIQTVCYTTQCILWVHNLSPGMVLTDLLLEGASPATRKLMNALAEEPDVVAADLVPRIR
jgi:hypothetical protein